MKLNDLVRQVGLNPLQDRGNLDVEVSGGYASDLLSDVMARAGERNVWITCQIHENIVAVARVKGLAAVIIVNNRTPDEEVLQRAREEGIPVFGTAETAFAVSGKLFALLSTSKDRCE
jgi:hypothetical protein